MKKTETFPTLETPRLLLRQLRSGDAPQIFKLRADENVMRLMDRALMETMEDARKMITDTVRLFTEEKGIIWAVVLKEDKNNPLIGYVGYHRRMMEDFRAEICYALLPEYWRQGLISEAAEAVIRFGFDKMNLHSIEGNVNPGNVASIKVLEKFNFQREAYFKENLFFQGEFRDSAIYSLLKRNFPPNKKK